MLLRFPPKNSRLIDLVELSTNLCSKLLYYIPTVSYKRLKFWPHVMVPPPGRKPWYANAIVLSKIKCAFPNLFPFSTPGAEERGGEIQRESADHAASAGVTDDSEAAGRPGAGFLHHCR